MAIASLIRLLSMRRLEWRDSPQITLGSSSCMIDALPQRGVGHSRQSDQSAAARFRIKRLRADSYFGSQGCSSLSFGVLGRLLGPEPWLGINESQFPECGHGCLLSLGHVIRYPTLDRCS